MSHTFETIVTSAELWRPRPMQSEDYKQAQGMALAGTPEPARV